MIYETVTDNPFIIQETIRVLSEIYWWKERNVDSVIKLGEEILKKYDNNLKFVSVLQNVKNNLSRAYEEKGNNYFWNQNYQVIARLGESYYNLGEYEKSKENFLIVIKNEKNNWYILFLSIFYYREISNPEERNLTLNELSEDTLSYKIFRSFEYFYSEKIKEGFDILKEEEIKRNTNGDIIFNIINKVFPYNLKFSKYYIEFIKIFPDSPKNQTILTNLFNNITEENERKILENDVWDLFNYLSKNERIKRTIIELTVNTIERKFDRRLSTVDDYILKINEYEKLLEKIDDDKYKEEIIKKIAEHYIRLEDYEKAIEKYQKLIELFKKENYYLNIGECYLKKGKLEDAKKIVEEFLFKNKENENAKFLLAKILIEKGEIKKGVEILNEIETITRDRGIQREIENLKKNFFVLKDATDNLLYIIIRKNETNITRLIPSEKVPFLNHINKEFEFYPYGEPEKETEFILKSWIENENFLSEPYVMINKDLDKFYLKWQDKIFIDKNKWKKKNIYKIFYPVIEKFSDEFDLKFKNEITNNKFILYFDFTFKEEDWEVKIKNYRNYDRPLMIEPLAKEEGDSLVWNVKTKNFKIKIEYPENQDIIFYFPEIEINKKKNEEKIRKLQGLFMLSGINLDYTTALNMLIDLGSIKITNLNDDDKEIIIKYLLEKKLIEKNNARQITDKIIEGFRKVMWSNEK
ncbi:MAG: hypothetical protein NZ891_02935 [bacterium]|nr:hypothetical protein [bacterium]MDW8163679.1 hypothetical protein [Candidatus Omnitrophota bacterium]